MPVASAIRFVANPGQPAANPIPPPRTRGRVLSVGRRLGLGLPGLLFLGFLVCGAVRAKSAGPDAYDNPFGLEALRRGLPEGDPLRDFAAGLEAAAFRRTEAAAAAIGRYLATRPADLKRRHQALATLASCRLRDGGYAEAERLFRRAYDECQGVLDADERRSALQCIGVAAALRDSPAQRTEALVPAALRFTRDKAGLANLALRVNGLADTAIWDTGANLSMVNATFAREKGLKPLPGEVEIGTSTGQPARGHMALADSVEIGGCRLRHVAFIVLPDAALAFPQADYAIRAVIGFPVIDALGAVRFEPGDRVQVGLPPLTGDGPSLALSGNTPLLAVGHRGDLFPFLLDSGARQSSLRACFTRRFPDLLRDARTERHQRGGAGGTIEVEEKILPKVTLSIGGGEATLKDVNVEADDSSSVSDVYGTIGSDLLYAGGGYEIDLQRLRLRILAPSSPRAAPSAGGSAR